MLQKYIKVYNMQNFFPFIRMDEGEKLSKHIEEWEEWNCSTVTTVTVTLGEELMGRS